MVKVSEYVLRKLGYSKYGARAKSALSEIIFHESENLDEPYEKNLVDKSIVHGRQDLAYIAIYLTYVHEQLRALKYLVSFGLMILTIGLFKSELLYLVQLTMASLKSWFLGQ